jgi:hypothetical protein
MLSNPIVGAYPELKGLLLLLARSLEGLFVISSALIDLIRCQK